MTRGHQRRPSISVGVFTFFGDPKSVSTALRCLFFLLGTELRIRHDCRYQALALFGPANGTGPQVVDTGQAGSYIRKPLGGVVRGQLRRGSSTRPRSGLAQDDNR